jgi:hypothetical protein
MHYAIFDSTGNLIESFEDEESARKALDRIVDTEPEAAEHVALFVHGQDGMPVGDPIIPRAVSARSAFRPTRPSGAAAAHE